METKLSISAISSYILSRPYVMLSEIESEFQISREKLNDYLEKFYENLTNLDLIVEIIEVNGLEYLLTCVKANNSWLSETQFGLLAIIGTICKANNGSIPYRYNKNFDENYETDISFLESNYYISKNKNGFWSISPLGALTLYPIMNQTEQLVSNLLKEN